jgi:alkyl sulfatase BDS1-like metallo-beta-lactamase superfamily hydrolase
MMRTPIYKQRPVEPNPARFGGERINDFIVMSEGFSNCYLIETSAGNIQLNAGMGMEAPVHYANFNEFSQGSVERLILTQGHVDHVGGVAFFRDQHAGLEVIAQANNPEHQAYDKRLADFRGARSAFAFTDKFATAFEYYQSQGLTEFPAQDAPTPDVLFSERYSFRQGDLEVELIAVPGAETNDSLIVWLPQHRICFTGNLFGCPFGHFPNLVTIRGDRYRDALTVAAAVQTVMALGADMIVYGHHQPVVGAELIRGELQALHGAIMHVHDATVAGMQAGKDVHELMSTITLPPEYEVGQGYGKVSWGVRAIWENYGGWFHHRSTTELYSVPGSAVHSELRDLCGAPALEARARALFAAGECERALHLLDILLSDEMCADTALALCIDIHRALLAESENFWLSAWLENRIGDCERRLVGSRAG